MTKAENEIKKTALAKSPQPVSKEQRKKIFSWALYDWANSSFSTTVVAGFFPVFLKSYWGQGISAAETTAALGTSLSIGGFLMAVLTPIFGALSDLRGYKKLFLTLSMLVGSLGCLVLAGLPSGQWIEALVVYGLAYMAYNASTVFNDSMLPSIARGTQMDYASSLGFALGYLGGGILFLLNVAWYIKPELFGFVDGVQAVKASFISVGIWWFVFTLPLLIYVPEPPSSKVPLNQILQTTTRTLIKTFSEIMTQKNIFLFLLAFWLYIDGVYTVITMAVDFGMSLGLDSKHLIGALLLVQFVGFPATWVFGVITDRWGCRKPILFCIGAYSVIVVLSVWMKQTWHFYALAVTIGLVQGGVQSLSRSLFGKMVPEQKSGEYFAFFNLVGRFASILGPLIVGFTGTLFKNASFGMAGLLVLFISGAVLLLRVDETLDAS